MDYKIASAASQQKGERNDCAVKALAIATGTEYNTVHALLAAKGRRKGGRTRHTWIYETLEELGFEKLDITRHLQGRTVRTVQRELVEGTFLALVSGHILAIKDGKVEDWTEGRQHRIRNVYAVYRKGEEFAGSIRKPEPAPVEKPKQGTIRDTIFELADRMWLEAGQPSDLKVVRKLRIQMMDELEKHGVKRTTASVELGQWQKLRLK